MYDNDEGFDNENTQISQTSVKRRLKKDIQLRTQWWEWAIVIVWMVILYNFLIIDICPFYKICVKIQIEIIEFFFFYRYEKINLLFRFVENNIYSNMDTICNTVITFSTILTAAIVFFYSVQDNKKEGIPHRRIISYVFGTYFIPILFGLSLVMIFILNLAWYMGFKYTAYYCVLSEFFFQLIVIALILLSTSFRFGIVAICYAESKQYMLLKDVSEKDKRENILHHMEQVVISDELISDKVELINSILRIPYCKSGIVNIWFNRNNLDLRKEYCSLIYYFYYENIVSSFSRLVSKEMKIERDRIYDNIYTFLEELTAMLIYELDKKYEENIKENYLMTVMAFMNAVQYSKAKEAEAFCRYIINKLVAECLRTEIILMYIIYQELLYQTDNSAISISNINKIKNIKKIDFKDEININRCSKFWKIWISTTSLDENDGQCYMVNAINSLCTKNEKSCVISYIKRQIEMDS